MATIAISPVDLETFKAQPQTAKTCNTKQQSTQRSSIRRKRSYRYTAHSLHKSNHYTSLPNLVTVHEDLNMTTLSRESSTESIKSETSSNHSARKVSFFNKVAVQEFRRLPDERDTTWYTSDEMRAFLSNEAARLVRLHNRIPHNEDKGLAIFGSLLGHLQNCKARWLDFMGSTGRRLYWLWVSRRRIAHKLLQWYFTDALPHWAGRHVAAN